MPPVAMIAVVLPAFSASRTSIQVISSIHTVFGAGSGFTASTQLYGFAVQVPPPMLRGSRAAADCAPPCALAVPLSPTDATALTSTAPRIETRSEARGETRGAARCGGRERMPRDMVVPRNG